MSPRTLRRSVRPLLPGLPVTGGTPKAHEGPAPLALLVYGSLTVVTVGIAFVRGTDPLTTDAWLPVDGGIAHAISIVSGIALAALTTFATRIFVARWAWARHLHQGLRPAIRHSGDATVVFLGLSSGVAEELFFRGLLTTMIGLVPASLAFGLLHQLRGRERWAWAGWATVMGFLFGSLFLATGSLLGPIVAHVAINIANLRFIRDTDVEPQKPRRLGGLLG